ncbi:hypothetical protein BG004_002222 [Podila humilis]|nr:hypothetical protein BG004_002222 [Podila humilis]
MSYFKRPAEYYQRTQWTYPDSLRIRGSVIPSVLYDVMVITVFSAAVMFVHASEYFEGGLNVPNVIALSIVVGLILAFRTNTAYDRYWEGRKLWATLDVQIRNFSRMIWVGMKDTTAPPHNAAIGAAKGVSMPTTASPGVGRGEGSSSSSSSSSESSSSPPARRHRIHNLFGRSSSSLLADASTKARNPSSATLIDIDGPSQDHSLGQEEDQERVLVIQLLLAFAVSCKHHLRQEFGIRYYDLENLLPPGYEPCAASEGPMTLQLIDKAAGDMHRHFSEVPWEIHAGNEEGQMSLPLEIAHGLSLWVIGEARASRIESSLVGNLLSSINTMVDTFTNMERIVFTPIPLAYSIHLRQVVYLYCLALPFTFLESLDWGTVPLMALVSFTLFGMEAIGREIENPFGKDANDLHMDEFCRDLKRELDYLVNLKNTIPGAHV